MSGQMMKCGHAANATNTSGKPCCAICAVKPGYDEPAEVDLSNRRAKCQYRTRKMVGTIHSLAGHSPEGVPSDTPGLAFFEHRPGEKFDRYYCGCHGWD